MLAFGGKAPVLFQVILVHISSSVAPSDFDHLDPFCVYVFNNHFYSPAQPVVYIFTLC